MPTVEERSRYWRERAEAAEAERDRARLLLHTAKLTRKVEHEVAEARVKQIRAALEEIANETEVHSKINQERLCCKFQDIAIRALADANTGKGGENG